MKRNGLFVLVLALAAVLCTGCGVKDEDLKSDPLVNADGTAPVGSTLVAPAPQDDFVLLDNKDILSANGLYYASWVNGDAQPYENSEGKTVDLYDAQLTLVVQENKTEDKAASAVEGWQTLAQQNYDISNTQTLTAAGQEGGFPVLFHALAVVLPPAAGRIPVAAEQRIHHAGDRRADQKPAQNADREQHQ